MALTFVCGTCGTHYPAEITGSRVIYFDDNRRIDLKKDNQDCDNCQKEIDKEAGDITEQARAKVRAKRQQHGT